LFYKSGNGAGNMLDYNVYYTEAGAASAVFGVNDVDETSFEMYKTNTPFDDHSLFINPNFVDEVAGDFHLSDSSYAANAGDPTYTGIGEKDMDGNGRILRARVDCGAYESPYALSVKAILPNQLAVYPNPTAGKIFLPKGAYTRYAVTNKMGQVVMQNDVINSSIDISNLPNDLYILTVTSDRGTFVSKVLKH
jgi:hypothetical protein